MYADKIRVGIISANWSLKVHGSAWRLLPGVEVAAICTAHRETAEAAARDFGIPKAYWDFEKMAADSDLDVIDVGTRPSFRQPMVTSALQNSKHVYCALPFAVGVPPAEEMLDLQGRSGRIGVVDAQFRHVPAAQYMKQLIDDGFLGRTLGFNLQLFLPLSISGKHVYPHSVYPEGGLAPYKWLAEKDSGAGGWRNFGTHSYLFLTHLLGSVADVCGCVTRGVAMWELPDGTSLSPQNEDLGQATVRLASGVTGTVQAGWCVPDTEGLRLEIWGDRGRLLYVDPCFGDGISAKLYGGQGRVGGYGQLNGAWLDVPSKFYEVPGTNFSKSNAPPYMVSMGWMFHRMIAAIRGDEAASPSFAEAVQAQRFIEAVIQSGESGSWRKLG